LKADSQFIPDSSTDEHYSLPLIILVKGRVVLIKPQTRFPIIFFKPAHLGIPRRVPRLGRLTPLKDLFENFSKTLGMT